MSQRVPDRLRRMVQLRARGKCEYCLRHESDSALPHQPDHIVSKKHGGEATAENLAWSCAICNLLKGPEVASLDPLTGLPTRLFHPRKDTWTDHFCLEIAQLVGVSPEGRATVEVLQFNRGDLSELRRVLIAKGRYP